MSAFMPKHHSTTDSEARLPSGESQALMSVMYCVSWSILAYCSLFSILLAPPTCKTEAAQVHLLFICRYTETRETKQHLTGAR